jgi:hypothetical protein
MKAGCIAGWGLSAVLALALGAGVYKVLSPSGLTVEADGRTAVLLLPAERNLVLAEMRGLLEAVQAITVAALDGDMDAVTATASRVGMAAAQGESAQMLGKLPLAFMKLGMSTHKGFDDLADLAREGGDGPQVLRQMGQLMLNCTSCHAGYRIGIEGEGKEL